MSLSTHERLREIVQAQRARSLETITITRGYDGMYVIADWYGAHVCEKRETMLGILRGTLDTQDAYYEERKRQP